MDIALAVVYTLLVWWFSTGAVLYLVGMPSHTFGISMTTATAAAAFAFYGLSATSGETTVASAFCAFSCALVIWGWHEMSFLTGYVTGPRRTPCPAELTPRQRFDVATQTVIYHEIAIVLTVAAIAALTRGSPNQFALWTFVVLWLARLSAKFNVFLGVANLSENFLPDHLRYLASYFRQSAMNPLFPISITATTVAVAMLAMSAGTATSAFEAAGWTLVATLAALALLEHWLMVVPLNATALWEWGLKSRAASPAAKPDNIVPLGRPGREPTQREGISGGRHAV